MYFKDKSTDTFLNYIYIHISWLFFDKHIRAGTQRWINIELTLFQRCVSYNLLPYLPYISLLNFS